MSAFSQSIEEYQAFQSQLGYYLDQEASVVQLTGRDRHSFLHNFCTADIKNLAAGKSTEAFVLSPKGKTLFFLQVLAAEDRLLLVVPEAQRESLVAHLTKYVIVEDVVVEHLGDAEVVYVYWEADGSYPTHIGEGIRIVVLSGPGVVESWGEQGRKPISREAFEMLRIEAGFPRSGIDVLESGLAQEFERDATAISFQKGCYLGQETVARMDALGHTSRALRILRVVGNRGPDDPVPDLELELMAEGKARGKVTSFAWSPRLQTLVLLALVKKPFHEPGRELQLGDLPLAVVGSAV